MVSKMCECEQLREDLQKRYEDAVERDKQKGKIVIKSVEKIDDKWVKENL